jgi:hypothetical protein
MHVFLHLNNSSDNKWLNFKIPFQSICTIIPFSTCSPTRHLRPIMLEFYCRNSTFGRVWGWHSHSRNGVLWDSWNFKVQLQGSKHFALRRSSWLSKAIEVKMSKMALYEPFGHLQHTLWQKERSRIKLPIWFPITKSQESTRPRCVQMECDTPLESSPIRGMSKELWIHKVPRVQIGIVSGLLFGSPGIKSHSDVGATE